jgi:hypothetical protein
VATFEIETTLSVYLLHSLRLTRITITHQRHHHPRPLPMAACNQIVAHFRLAQKQLALLRHYQRELWGKIKALTLAGNTRWGSQVGELRSLKRSMDALRRWARDLQNECENEVEILHEAQIMSESSKGNLSHVYSRWNKVKDHLTTQHALIRTDLLRGKI